MPTRYMVHIGGTAHLLWRVRWSRKTSGKVDDYTKILRTAFLKDWLEGSTVHLVELEVISNRWTHSPASFRK